MLTLAKVSFYKVLGITVFLYLKKESNCFKSIIKNASLTILASFSWETGYNENVSPCIDQSLTRFYEHNILKESPKYSFGYCYITKRCEPVILPLSCNRWPHMHFYDPWVMIENVLPWTTFTKFYLIHFTLQLGLALSTAQLLQLSSWP